MARLAYDTVREMMAAAVDEPDARPGMVAVIQTFGSSLKWNPHIHAIEQGSDEEIEIRASAIWACHLLTEAVNRRRPDDRQVIEPVIDARLWTHYHETHWPHHLTVTTAY
jgi:hypothetical protein